MIVTFLKLCVNVMNRNIKIQNILTLSKNQNLYNLVKIFNKTIYGKTLFMCFLYFPKV
jgi:hypothetical protein